MDHIIHSKNPIPPSQRPLEMASVWILSLTILAALLSFVPSLPAFAAPLKASLVFGGAFLALISYVVARLSRGNIVVPPLMLLGFFWFPAIAYGLSTLFAAKPLSAIFGTGLETDTFGFIATATLLGTVTALATRNTKHYRALLRALLIAAGIVVCVQLGVLLLGQFVSSFLTFSILGSFGDTGIFAGLLVLGLLLAQRTLDLSAWAARWCWAGIAGALVLLSFSGTSLIWIILTIASLGLFIEAHLKRQGGSVADIELENTEIVREDAIPEGVTAAGHTVVTPLVVFLVSLVFLVVGNSFTANLLHIQTLSVRPSWPATISVLSGTYANSPLFGSGPGTFRIDWTKYRNPAINSTPFWNIDFTSGIGFVPTSFVTTGIVGAFAWVLFLGMLLFIGIRVLLTRLPSDPFIRFCARLSFLVATYVFLCSIFDVPGPALLSLGFVAVGLFVSTLRFSEDGGQWGVVFSKAPRLSLGIVVVLLLILLGSIAAEYFLAIRYGVWMDLAEADVAFARSDFAAARDGVTRSIALNPSARAFALQANIDLSALNAITASPGTDLNRARQNFQGTLTDGIKAGLASTQLAPDDYRFWTTLGSLYGTVVPFKVAGAYDNARAAYQKALDINPKNPQLWYLMAQLNIANQTPKAAEDALKQAINLKPDFTVAIVLLSQLQVSDGNLRDALSAAEAALYFTPNDPNILFQVGVLRAANGNLQGAAEALSSAVVANPQFANARYLLAATYAKLHQYQNALAQIDAIAALSAANTNAVASIRTALASGKDPFPVSLLSVTQTPVQ